MRRAAILIVFTATILVALGCSSPVLAPNTGGSPAPGTTPAPATTPNPGGPTIAPPTQAGVPPAGGSCAEVPTFAPGQAPSFAPDVDLAARFPQQVDGVPVTGLNSLRMVDYLCTLGGGQVAVDYFASNVPQGLNFATLSHAYADAIVEGEEVDLTAYRAPGLDPNLMIQSFSQLIRALGGGDTEVVNTATATIGGKNVFVLTDENGGVGYLYPLGDVLFVVSDVVTDSQAAKIFTAFP